MDWCRSFWRGRPYWSEVEEKEVAMGFDDENSGWGPEEIIAGLLILDDLDEEGRRNKPRGGEPKGCSLSTILLGLLFLLWIVMQMVR